MHWETALRALAIGTFLLAGCSDDGGLLAGDDDDDNDDGAADADTDSDSDGDGDGDGDMDSDPQDDPETDTDSETETETETEDDCDTEAPVQLFLSADDSNSMASPVLARRQILDGGMVTTAIRPWEFLNYYSFDYTAAPSEQIAVTAQMRATEEVVDGLDQLYHLQIGVRSWNISPAGRRPVNLTLSLDTSGSMSGPPIERVRDCCLAIAGSLKSGDVISVVDWNTAQNVILESHEVSGPDDAALVSACESLSASGGTDLHAGLVKAYELAQENHAPERINRVILMSDGGANVGVTDENLIADNADDSEQEGIYLMGVGVGSTGYFNEALMDTITDAGKGAYIFVDTEAEAQKMFGERFVSNIEIAARDVRVELALPPTFEMVVFHGEEWSTNPDDVEPQHLAPNDAMIYHQILGSCDSSVLGDDSPVTITAHWQHRFTLEPMETTLETSLGGLLAGDAALLRKGDAVTAFADALKALKTLSGQEALDLIDATLETVGLAIDALGADPDLVEIEDLLETYRNNF
jgi:Ca-activated chloride channel family protein